MLDMGSLLINFMRSFHSKKVKDWKNIGFNTQKRNKTKNDFEKDSFKLLNNPFYRKRIENVRDRVKIEFNKKDDNAKIIKQQSKLTFNGIHKPYTNYDSSTFKQIEVLMDKPIYLGFAVLELSKFFDVRNFI